MKPDNFYKFFYEKRDKVFFHLPFSYLDENIAVINEINVNWEIFISQTDLDSFTEEQIINKINLLPSKSFTIHAPFNDLNPASSDRYIYDITMLRHVQLRRIVQEIKPLRVVVHPGYEDWRYNFNSDKWVNGAKVFFKDLLLIFPETVFAIENVFEKNPDNLTELVKIIESDYFGICLDIGHFNLFSKISFKEWWNKIKDSIKHIHIHDNNGKRDQHIPPGRGVINWVEFLEVIKDKELTYTFEMHSIDDINFVLKMMEE